MALVVWTPRLSLIKQGHNVTLHEQKQHQTLPVRLLSPLDEYRMHSFLAHPCFPWCIFDATIRGSGEESLRPKSPPAIARILSCAPRSAAWFKRLMLYHIRSCCKGKFEKPAHRHDEVQIMIQASPLAADSWFELVGSLLVYVVSMAKLE